jgi:Rrf2 family protein
MDHIIKISEATAIALHAMALLAQRPPGQPLSVKQIAGTLGISADHLSKILQRLEKELLVQSVRGPKGGYLIVPMAAQLPMLKVFAIFEGPLSFSGCLMRRSVCKTKPCSLSLLLGNLHDQIIDFLKKTRIKDINPFDVSLTRSHAHAGSTGKR